MRSHGDYRTDNLFFAPNASGVVVIDFQLLRHGGPIAVLQDVAYLLVISTRMIAWLVVCLKSKLDSISLVCV